MTNTTASMEDRLIEFGCKVWEKGDRRRIYFGFNAAELFGIGYKDHQLAGSCAYGSTINGVEVSNNAAWGALNSLERSYYDCVAQTFVGVPANLLKNIKA